MQATNINGIKVYNISAPKKRPEWLSEQQRRKLQKEDEDFRRRIHLLQDFEFPTAAQRIKVSKDGNYVAATGVYKPRVKVFDVRELSLKFERHLDCEVVQFQMLSEDFRKMAFLQADRTVELHAAYGSHHKTRIPKVGRDMCYHSPTAELYIGGSSDEIYRLNLEEGRFMAPLSSHSPEINALGVSPSTQLVGSAGSDGVVELWDPRSRNAVGRVEVGSATNASKNAAVVPGFETLPQTSNENAEATAIRFDNSGLGMAVGTSDGRVQLYDLRSRVPLLRKHHQYGLPIVDLKFHSGPGSGHLGTSQSESESLPQSVSSGEYVVSTDPKIIKIWNRGSGKNLTNIEPDVPINDIALLKTRSGIGGGNGKLAERLPDETERRKLERSDAKSTNLSEDSGLILVAGEKPEMMSYYVPDLGLAPRWCSFLDSLTEELEEKKEDTGTVYEDYKFVTRDELVRLGLSHLIGTSLLKSYMHGFFMDIRLYNKVQAIADPFAYERWRKAQVKQKLEEKRGNRINIQRKLPQVNSELAKELMHKQKSAGENPTESNPLGDERFNRLFSDPEFQIDSQSAAYKAVKSTESQKRKHPPDEYDAAGTTTEADSAFDSVLNQVSEAEEEGVAEEDEYSSKKQPNTGKKKSRGPAKSVKFFETKDNQDDPEIAAKMFGFNPLKKKERNLLKKEHASLADRIEKAEARLAKKKQRTSSINVRNGAIEAKFTPQSNNKGKFSKKA
eukprot:gb/GECG01005943.1/.p1 GENE.gb/GECG01005943.1/~~gb/GECG01005943.1/.p1  ORF type:complete len:730 (+),score=123.29 gb/GECG01005943.1/:1-2190(+)